MTIHNPAQVSSTIHNGGDRASPSQKDIENWTKLLGRRVIDIHQDTERQKSNRDPLGETLAEMKTATGKNLPEKSSSLIQLHTKFVQQHMEVLRHVNKCQGALLSFLPPKQTIALHCGNGTDSQDFINVTSYYICASKNAYRFLDEYNRVHSSSSLAFGEHSHTWKQLILSAERDYKTILGKGSVPDKSDGLNCFESLMVLTLRVVVGLLSRPHEGLDLKGLHDLLQGSEKFNERSSQSPYLRIGYPEKVFIGRVQHEGKSQFLVTGSKTRTAEPLYPKDWAYDCHYGIILTSQEALRLGQLQMELAESIVGNKPPRAFNSIFILEKIPRLSSDCLISGKALKLPEFRPCGKCRKCRHTHAYDEGGIQDQDLVYSKGGKRYNTFYPPLACAEDVFAVAVVKAMTETR